MQYDNANDCEAGKTQRILLLHAITYSNTAI